MTLFSFIENSSKDSESEDARAWGDQAEQKSCCSRSQAYLYSSQNDGKARNKKRNSSLTAKWSLSILGLCLLSQLWKPFHVLSFKLTRGSVIPSTFRNRVTGPSPSDGTQPTPSLVPFMLQPLPLGTLKPEGWVADQMNLMAAGLAGHQFDFYQIVRESPWLGGRSEYSGLNEGLPYWLNGLVPLAYGLDDTRLKAQIHQATDYILTHQQSDGWLGPETEIWSRDIWGHFPLFLGFCQLADTNTELSSKVIVAMYKFIDLMHDMLLDNIGFNEIWGRVRYPDMLICLQWLYEHHPRKNQHDLLETMHLLKARGLSWAEYYDERRFIFTDLDAIQPPITASHSDFPFVHGVNAGQGLKSGATIYRFNADESLLQNTRNGVNWTFTYHGDVAGSIIGDERESNLSPNRGSELCAAVEAMYSLSYLYQVLGDNDFADRCELAAFNALPVMFTSDHWARQYISLANQPFSHNIEGPNAFWNVGDAGLVYGPATNYPCCTVNTPQGLPKFLSASFLQVGQNGLAHALLSPATAITTLQNGVAVRVSCKTNYPFSNTLRYTIFASSAFTFHLRVPAWQLPSSASITLDGASPQPATPDPHTGLMALHLHAGLNKVTYTLTPTMRIVSRANATVAIYHGALLYALDVGQLTLPRHSASARIHPETSQPWQAHDYSIVNTRPWNIAIDPSTLTFHPAPPHSSPEELLTSPIYALGAPPPYISGRGCEIEWPLLRGMPAPVPLADGDGKRVCKESGVEVVLRPYGSLKVHMAELPVVDLDEDERV